MMADPSELIDGYLDDLLDADQQETLGDWIKSDPKNAQVFALASLLHDRMRSQFAIDSSSAAFVDPDKVSVLRGRPEGSWPTAIVWRAVVAASLLVAGLVSVWFSFGTSTASAASRELDRIIVSTGRSKDRTYAIVVEDISRMPERRGKRESDLETQRPPKPSLDRAILHLRKGGQFVLIRNTAEGLPFITGSDGKQSWAINTRGPVRVSSDIHQFDRDLPGHETSVPLTNLHEGLEQLKKAYSLEFSTLGPEEFVAENGEAARLLVAVKKPKERGPQRVEIAYDASTGRILRMRFVQMPYGPDRLDLRLSLMDENELPTDFFEHSSHHNPERRIETEN